MPIEIHIVDNGREALIPYVSSVFLYNDGQSDLPATTQLGFSGFRIHMPHVQPDPIDEFIVFQGSSYFRGRTQGQEYGLSARGLAINTARPPADEFPIFRAFWIVKPAASAAEITVFALLDSESVSGLYRFIISFAEATIMDVSCTLFPRKEIHSAGLAPMTSMFFIGPSSRLRFDEARPRVHNSDGLLIYSGGDYVWRPLINGNRVAISNFPENDLKGFGLLQREREADRYQDFNYTAHYESRPSLWMEPRGNWGEGSVELVELPTTREVYDNIVAYWHPKEPLARGGVYNYRYRLTWGYGPPLTTERHAIVAQTLVGASHLHPEMRMFHIDFKHAKGSAGDCISKNCRFEAEASAGSLFNATIVPNNTADGHRVSFEYLPAKEANQADIRCLLLSEDRPVSEIWVYRWET